MIDHTTLMPSADKEFVETSYIQSIMARAKNYLEAGFPVHFRGPAGTGKSTLAKHLASQLGRPVVLIHGDEQMDTNRLVGGESGYQFKKVRDNFISTVLKEEEVMTKHWSENQVTSACKHGYTLIYDEFTRSRPEANNIFLSILQDRLLTLNDHSNRQDPYISVHRDFKAIFTSNPEEYAGTHKTQDALRDRMVTIDLEYPDFDTELNIVYNKARLPMDVCILLTKIIRTLRNLKEYDSAPTIRSGIMIAKTLTVMDMEPSDNMPLFITYCQDILTSNASPSIKRKNQELIKKVISEIVASEMNQKSRFLAS